MSHYLPVGLDRCLTVCARTHLPIHNHTTLLATPIAPLLSGPNLHVFATFCLTFTHAPFASTGHPVSIWPLPVCLQPYTYMHPCSLAVSCYSLTIRLVAKIKDQRPNAWDCGIDLCLPGVQRALRGARCRPLHLLQKVSRASALLVITVLR